MTFLVNLMFRRLDKFGLDEFDGPIFLGGRICGFGGAYIRGLIYSGRINVILRYVICQKVIKVARSFI